MAGLAFGVTALAGLAAFSVSSNARTTEHIRTAALRSDTWNKVTLDVSVMGAAQGPAELDGVPVEISSSLGAALFPVHGASPAELLQRADLAMYAAKRTGGGAAIYHPRIDRRRPVEAARS